MKKTWATTRTLNYSILQVYIGKSKIIRPLTRKRMCPCPCLQDSKKTQRKLEESSKKAGSSTEEKI